MSQLSTRNRIKQLPVELANQIAAGEVIERPASVLKELVENALDADASRIEIELQGGGVDSISVIDNGQGIAADELPLAISRHATSKIDKGEDLLNLTSLGFRGEALASICSVSQWELISRENETPLASRMSFDFPDQLIEVNHAVGTRVSIRKLFYNTPARKKFLKAERTELQHCVDTIKRLALSHFNTGFYVRHNERQILRLPRVQDDIGRTRRVGQICGEQFTSQSIAVDFPYAQMRLWGWISQPAFSRQSTDLQYFYINGRVIRDRVINHAIRSVYQACLPAGRHAAFVLHLDMPAQDVDVNVHPTKHEVRFREPRLIHDFISRSVRQALQQTGSATLSYTLPCETTVNANQIREIQTDYTENAQTAGFLGQLRDIYFSRYIVSTNEQQVYLIDLQRAMATWVAMQWRADLEQGQLQSLPLLIPQTVTVTDSNSTEVTQQLSLLNQTGFDIVAKGPMEYLLRKIPVYLRAYPVNELVAEWLQENGQQMDFQNEISHLLIKYLPEHDRLSIPGLLQSIAMSPDDYRQSWQEITAKDLAGFLTKI